MPRRAEQPDLFASANAPLTNREVPAVHGAADGDVPVAPAPVPAAEARVAGALPGTIRFGTSSWAFPGWAGLVYAHEEPAPQLSRHGLSAYARHPLLRTVGLDRTFYAPISAAEFANYAGQVPVDFRFLVKAHSELTTPTRGAAAGRFLDAMYASEAVVQPTVAGLGGKLGVLLFQFPPLRLSGREAERFPERLGEFLAGLPRGVPYAVEIRNRELLTPAYVEALAAHGVTHCYTVHPSMPDVLAQRSVTGTRLDHGGTVALRWMLRPDQRYESAREAWAPFDALVDPDLSSRTQIAELLRALAAAGPPVIVIANNKAEGSAPRTLAELARMVAPAAHSP